MGGGGDGGDFAIWVSKKKNHSLINYLQSLNFEKTTKTNLFNKHQYQESKSQNYEYKYNLRISSSNYILNKTVLFLVDENLQKSQIKSTIVDQITYSPNRYSIETDKLLDKNQITNLLSFSDKSIEYALKKTFSLGRLLKIQ
ncbi:hypothetical protein HC864_03990 [Candidatus Gracilibacteria bacterium]|nr:hypothetical protein [Candidatus Gracilibacteria bacterium]